MDVKQTIYHKIVDGSFALLTDDEIVHKLKLKGRPAARLRDMLRALCAEHRLLRDLRGRLGTAEQFGAIRGTLSGNERGFGFVVPDDPAADDLFIPHRALHGAYHGDTVLAFRKPGRGAGDEGEILSVLQRGRSSLVGTFRRERNGGYVHPDEKKFHDDIFIPSDRCNNAEEGAKVVVNIVAYDERSPRGEIAEILGKGGDFFVEERALIRGHELTETFPDDVITEAERQARRIPEESLAGREDLRDRLIITIDGEDTRDIDDAISLEKRDGLYFLGVHIADVSHYVARGGVIDREAYRRGTSVYFPDRVLPMLPTALSNDICSLNEGVTRLTLSCLMTIDGRGNVVRRKIVPSVIVSRHRMTYTQVTAIAEGDAAMCEKYADLTQMIADAVELTHILQRAREARGGIALDIKEAKILYENGTISIPDYKRTVSHEMIEQFMVLANESVATEMTERGMPFIYRIHERPSEEKARDFLTFLREAGIDAKFDPERVSPSDYKKLLDSLKDSPLYPLVNRVMLRSMMKAIYSPENAGHFGLASACYCHFTSPIRRYPDLCIHRIIKESLRDPARAETSYRTFVKDAAVRSSACEKNATEAERDVDALYTVAYMQDKIGEEYTASISGVTSFGLFAELKNTVEGFIPIETLPEDGYVFVEERFLLRGTRNAFHLGEAVRIKVAGVDWGARRVQFLLLGKEP